MKVIYQFLFFIIISTSLLFFISCNSNNNVSAENKDLVFLSNRDNTLRYHDIFITNIDSLQINKLSKSDKNVISTSNPTISNSGKEVAYMHLEKGKKFLAIINLENNLTELKFEIKNSAPVFKFTNDDSKLIFTDIVNQKRQIFCYNLRTNSVVNLSDSNFHEFEPSISNNGKFITYTREEKKGHSIWVMNMDGSEKREVFNNNVNSRFPSFSPDNETIIFSTSYKSNSLEDFDIYEIKINGIDLEIIFDDNYYLKYPSYSPNGQFIAWQSNRRGKKYQDLFVKNNETDEVINITRELDFLNINYSFSNDSKFIVFENIVFNNAEIFLYNFATEEFRNITNDPSWDSSPSI